SLLRLFALSMVLQLFAIISPFYMQLVVDEGIVSHDQHLLTVLSLGFFLVAVIQIGVSFLRGYFMLYVGNLMSIQLAANLFRHLIRLPMSFFEKRHIGDIVSRFGSLGRIKQLLTTDIIEAIVDGMMAITTLVMMMMYASTLGYIVLASVTIYGVIRFALYRPLKTLTEESIVCSAKEHSTFMETVRAIQSIKVFGKEVQRQSVWQNRYADALNADIKVSKLSLYYSALNGLLFGMENILVIYTGANMVLANAMSVGMLFAFISYKTQFEGKATNLINKVIELRMLGLHLERLADIALTPPELVDQNLIVAEKEVKIEGRL
ncbi:MAG: ABC transporter transmembrane domain-containing protein, partial [Pseudomonadota bacterium]